MLVHQRGKDWLPWREEKLDKILASGKCFRDNCLTFSGENTAEMLYFFA